ncbi:MAG TPA: NAD/FAD-utilizing enzyme [Spongiibacteraceae bacterium]|nr:NAD/FAD-utilizing enzyme [Spongiibacteraceae bacterium]HCS27138.1 NAD/FAD-utilizing enzyme [Spongiibacteraceae bacterium]
MNRHYYISDDLDDLAVVESDLEQAGVTTPQIHVLSEDDAGLTNHHLHQVEAVLKKDVVRGTELGAVVGIVGAALVLAVCWYTGFAETYTWVPGIFLAIVILGFCTWEGGLIGIQEPHAEFRQFQDVLKAGKHILFVDVDPDQEAILERVTRAHPKLEAVGVGAPTPRWVIRAQQKWAHFLKVAP